MIGRKAAPAPDTVPFDALRAHAETIRSVVNTLRALAIMLYLLIATLLFLAIFKENPLADAVPGELWAAATGATGIIGGLLVSTKAGGSGGQTVNAEAGSTVISGTPADDVLADPAVDDLASIPADTSAGAGDVPPSDPAAVQSDADDPDTPAVDPNEVARL